jgi:putative transposase
VKVTELVRKHGISEATFYNWKAKFGGLDVSLLRRLKELEAESARLKRMYAELSLTHHVLQDAFKKSFSASRAPVRSPSTLLQAATHRLAIQIEFPGNRRDTHPRRPPHADRLPLLFADHADLRRRVDLGYGSRIGTRPSLEAPDPANSRHPIIPSLFHFHRMPSGSDGWGIFDYHNWGLLDYR